MSIRWRETFLILVILFSSFAKASATRPGYDPQPLVFLPFEEGTTVHCVQAPGGTYTHQGTLYYSYDFDMGNTSNSTSNPIFGQDLLSPVNGTIIEIRLGVEDFQCNSSAASCNNYGWGNTIVIQPDHSDYLIRIAHMRQYSTPEYLSVNDHIDQGTVIGEVGQTGISTHPHLHIQVTPSGTTQTVKFEFVEGRVTSGTWLSSQLEPHKYVLDNDRRTNLGAPIDNPNNWYTGSFSLYASYGNAHGDDYRRSASGATGTQSYYWAFTTFDYTGSVDVYANCRVMSYSNDNQAQYRFYGGGVSIYETVNQTTQPYWHVASTILDSYTRYYIRTRRMNSDRRVCADSILIYLDDE